MHVALVHFSLALLKTFRQGSAPAAAHASVLAAPLLRPATQTVVLYQDNALRGLPHNGIAW